MPLHNGYLKSDFIPGPVNVDVKPDFPIQGISLTLRNVLAGDKVRANLIMSNKPCETATLDIEEEVRIIFPSCVVTRSMNKKISKSSDISTENSVSYNNEEDEAISDSVGL